jgi:hypothetical protein
MVVEDFGFGGVRRSWGGGCPGFGGIRWLQRWMFWWVGGEKSWA